MKYASRAFEWLLILPAILPLVYVEGMMYPLMTPKTLALRAFGIIAFALFSYLLIAGHAFYWHRLRRWETWIPAALLAVAYLSSFFGTDFYRSFWSTFERGDGLFTLTVCVGYFYFIMLAASPTWLERLSAWVAWVGSLAAVYLVLQWFTTNNIINLPFIVEPNGRIGGTLGNAAFLAAYLGMAFFATLATAREHGTFARRVLYAGAALELAAIALTATRGTILALVAIGIIVLAYLAFNKRDPSPAATLAGALRTARPSLTPAHIPAGSGLARLTLLTLVVLAGLFFTFRTALQQVPIETVHRLASISLTDPTVASRLFIWRAVSAEAFSKHPLLGYGAEHISIPFDAVYDPTAITEEWFDRTHNAYLDYFVQFGVIGALLYLALVGAFIRIGWRLWRRDAAGRFILGIGAVYAIQNFFVFDTGVTLWLFCALFAAALVQASAREGAPVALLLSRPWTGIVVGSAITLLIIPAVIQPLRANLLAFEAYLYQIVDVPRANAAAEKGVALRTYADLEFGYNAFFMYTTEQVNRLSGSELAAAASEASKLLTIDFNRYPYDARTAVYLAQVLTAAPEGVQADKALLSQVLAHAIQESPKRAQPWYILANLSISDANMHPVRSPERAAGYAAAHDILSRYITLVPTLAKPYFVLAQLDYASGAVAAANREAAIGKTYYRSDLEVARRAASFYERVLDLPNAAFFLREVLRLDPGNANASYDLSQIEAQSE